MASSNLSPPMRTASLSTMPPSDIRATSVVPPPMSRTMFPLGLVISIPAPSAAATGSSIKNHSLAPALRTASSTARFSTEVVFEGTQTMTRGLNKGLLPQTLWMKCLSMRSVISKSAITPSRKGRTAIICPGVRPIMRRASSPIAKIRLLLRSMATTAGSLSTTPLPRT